MFAFIALHVHFIHLNNKSFIFKYIIRSNLQPVSVLLRSNRRKLSTEADYSPIEEVGEARA